MFSLVLVLGGIAGFFFGYIKYASPKEVTKLVGIYPSSTSCLSPGEFATKVSKDFQDWYSTCVAGDNGGNSGNNGGNSGGNNSGGNNGGNSGGNSGGNTPPGDVPPPSEDVVGIWISPEEIAKLPISGSAWNRVATLGNPDYRKNDSDFSKPNLSDQDSDHPIKVLAMAYKAVRLNDANLKKLTVKEINSIQGTEKGARALAIGRNMMAYVVAADLLNYRPGKFDPYGNATAFVNWLRNDIQKVSFSGKTLKKCHDDRPNNWGTMCGASRIAIDLYLNDKDDLTDAVKVFKGYLGDKSAYNDFTFNVEAANWTCETPPDPKKPKKGLRPIAPKNCFLYYNGTKVDMSGAPIDDVQRVEDKKKTGFVYPIPKTHYAWGGFSAAVAQAEMLYRAGYTNVYNWQDKAIWRGMDFLNREMPTSDSGATYWLPWIVNKRYGTDFPTKPNANKNSRLMNFTDWTHAR